MRLNLYLHIRICTPPQWV